MAELSVEEKLKSLYELQLIDSQLDELEILKGELPMEVSDLEDEIAGLETRIRRLCESVEDLEDEIARYNMNIAESKALIERYNKQLDNVKNNREYEALTKEIELQTLEIQLAEKNIKEFKAQIEQKKEVITQTKEKLTEREGHLKHKKGELDAILAETEKEEKALLKKSEEFEEKIEDRLIQAYKRIRTNVKNGLAVVPVERGASGGSFFTIPPQVQVEIASRKNIITDEHSGRILVDPLLAEEEQERMEKLFAKL